MHHVAIDHFCRYLFPSSLKVNGDLIAFIGKRASLEDNKYYSDMYLFDGKTARALTSSGEVESFYWLGDSLIFPDIRKDKDKERVEKKLPLTVLQRLDPGYGEAQEFARFPLHITDIAFISEDEYYFTATYDPALESLPSDNEEKAAKTLKEENDYIVLDEIPFWHNGRGFTNKKRNRLYHYHAGEIDTITDEFTDVLSLKFSQKSKDLVFIAQRFTNKMETSNRLYLLKWNGKQSGAPVDISVKKDGYDHQNCIAVAPDILLIEGTDRKEYGLGQNGDFFLYNYVTGEKIMIDDSRDYNGANAVGSDVKMPGGFSPEWQIRDGFVYFLETIDDSTHIMAIDLQKRKIEQVTKAGGLIQECVLHDQHFVAIAMRGNDGPELYDIDLKGNEQRLTRFNADAIAGYALSTPETFTFTNEEGNEIRGWIMKPTDFDPGTRYPVILDIHGGPKMSYGSVFFHEMQYWAACGYAVIFCNPTGSEGKGARCADIRGKYGAGDYRDIMTFVDKCLERSPWMDGERMGVTGGSYGGFMTNWIIGHTGRFKAAAAQRSISNWLSKSNTTDIGYYFNADQIGETAWSDSEKLWWHSPLKYADQVTTPTLFIHSDEDYRCWLAEGLQMYTALKFFGVEARMCIFRGENHELSRSGLPKHRVRRLEEITAWFDAHLKGPSLS